ncbi:MAG: ABC transporter permease [Sterolibacteriaceae bacterium]|nr:ABC transporter permease [Sterolibacteriaceae bacterium]
MRAVLAHAFLGHLVQQPGRALMSVLALALGVALGVAVSVVNRSALDEFGRGLRTVSGQADLEVRGARGGFDESLYPQLAQRPEVETVSPLLEIEAKVRGAAVDGGGALKLIGLDVFRAASLSVALIPPPAQGTGRGERTAESARAPGLLDDDTLYLSPAAAQRFGLASGDAIALQSGVGSARFRIGGLLPAVGAGQMLAVTDIATAQWRFERLGVLTRIDLRLREGVDAASALRAIGADLPPGVFVATPAQAESQAARLSRAYRVNLTMLALIALVTGAILVFSAQAVNVVRRRAELAFLRAAGITRGALVRWLLLEGGLIGALGSLIGVPVGYALAALALRLIGGDLGAGYFQGAAPALAFDPWGTTGFVALGIAAALAGSAAPAIEAARSDPALALKSGDAADSFARFGPVAPGLLCLSAALAIVWLPPIGGLPVFGYAAIALLLIGSVLILPRLARLLFARLPTPRAPWLALAVLQLRGAPHLATLGAAGVLAAVALAGAMAIMVGSFRQSVDVWLGQVLPADLYLRASRAGESGHFDAAEQAAIRSTPGLARIDFLRHQSLLLDPALPQVALIARPLAADRAALPLLASVTVPAGSIGVLASEAMQDLYGWQLGQRVRLPLAGREIEVVVAGIWRDYARQHGAVAIDLATYRTQTGDMRVNDVGLWLAPGADTAQVARALRARLPADSIELAEPGEIRNISLGIFDRTFAVTYALEAVAVAIGIAGVAASFAALAAARRREFGVLRHIGLTRGEIARMLGAEGALVAVLGVLTGLATGAAISLILIHVVNRQSFHWSMELVLPWGTLALFGLTMTLLATAAAVLSARAAMQVDAVRAVREDW